MKILSLFPVQEHNRKKLCQILQKNVEKKQNM